MDPRSSKELEDIPDALSQGLQANDRDTSGRPSKNSRNSQPVPTSALSKTDAIKSPRAALHQVPRDSLLVNGTDSLDRYFMGHENRGLAIIINNKSFHKDLKLSERHGTDVDATALEDAFKTLGRTIHFRRYWAGCRGTNRSNVSSQRLPGGSAVFDT